MRLKIKPLILFSTRIKELIENKKFLFTSFFLPYYKRRTATKLILILLSGVFFLFLRTLKRYNKTNINRLFKSDIFLERRKFQQFVSTKIVLLIINMMSKCD